MNIATFNKTAVSLGLGRIERAILAIVDVEDEYEQSYAAEDLAIDILRRRSDFGSARTASSSISAPKAFAPGAPIQRAAR